MATFRPKLVPIKKNNPEQSDFHRVFAKYDKDGSKTLCKAEFMQALKDLGLEWSQELENEFDCWDSSGDGQVSYVGENFKKSFVKIQNCDFCFSEFAQKFSDPNFLKGFLTKFQKNVIHKPTKPTMDHLNHGYISTVFENCDKNKSGSLTKDEFQHIFEQLGLDWRPEFEAQFHSWDMNGDGQVCYEGKCDIFINEF